MGRILLEYKASVMDTDQNKKSVLSYAILHEHNDFVMMLLSKRNKDSTADGKPVEETV